MALQQFSESELKELSILLRGVLECDNKIDALKENIKNFTASKKDMFESLAEKFEVDVSDIKQAYKEYLASISDPEKTETVSDIVVLIKEFNLLNQEEKK